MFNVVEHGPVTVVVLPPVLLLARVPMARREAAIGATTATIVRGRKNPIDLRLPDDGENVRHELLCAVAEAEPSLSRTHRGWVWRMASDLGASGVLQACTTPIVRRREKSRKREVKHRRDCASLALAILRRHASIAYISASYRLPHVFGSFPPSARPKGCPSVSPLRHRLLTG